MVHHKGYGEKLEEAREGKVMMNKAGLLQRDGRQADSACEAWKSSLGSQADFGHPELTGKGTGLATALPQRG